ncbi:MAG: UbiA family prenyltransferase [Candidatus Aenigmatarchaeota archaeon]
MTILKKIRNEFIYGGHLQSLGTVAIVYISCFLLNAGIDWLMLFSCYLLFYPIYLFDRYRGLKIDALTNPERTKHISSYLSLIPKILCFSVFLLIVLLIYIGNFKFLVFSIILLALGLLYPIYFKNLTKRIFGFKNFFVASFFTIIILIPVIYYNYLFSTSLIIPLASLMLLVFMKAILMQISLDYKDIESDKKIGLLTFPVIMGKKKTLIFLKISNLVLMMFILPLLIFLVHGLPLQMVLLLLIIPINFYSYYLMQKQNYFAYLFAGGEFIFWGFLILIADLVL